MRGKILEELKLISALVEEKRVNGVVSYILKDAMTYYEIAMYGDMDLESVPWRTPVPVIDGRPASDYADDEIVHIVYAKFLNIAAEIREMERKTYTDHLVFEKIVEVARYMENKYDKDCKWEERY